MIIEIPGDPIPWARPAEGRHGTKTWRYDSQKAEKLLIRQHMQGICNAPHTKEKVRELREGKAVKVRFNFLFGVPPSDSEKTRNAKLWGFYPHNIKPDWDNVAKFYMDCGNGLLWSDDKMCNRAEVKKDFSENPRTIIEIMTKENLELSEEVKAVLSCISPGELIRLAQATQEFRWIYAEDVTKHSAEGWEGATRNWSITIVELLLDFAREQGPILNKIAQSQKNSFRDKALPLC